MSHSTRVCVWACQLDQVLFCLVRMQPPSSVHRTNVHTRFQVRNNSSESTFLQLWGLWNINMFTFYCLFVAAVHSKEQQTPLQAYCTFITYSSHTSGRAAEENLNVNLQIWAQLFNAQTKLTSNHFLATRVEEMESCSQLVDNGRRLKVCVRQAGVRWPGTKAWHWIRFIRKLSPANSITHPEKHTIHRITCVRAGAQMDKPDVENVTSPVTAAHSCCSGFILLKPMLSISDRRSQHLINVLLSREK